uniref:Uncharacterized protein n=1 Tax=Physcomitrium patens TaxID=3218 RepID=A0A7I3ZL14_PHYPA
MERRTARATGFSIREVRSTGTLPLPRAIHSLKRCCCCLWHPFPDRIHRPGQILRPNHHLVLISWWVFVVPGGFSLWSDDSGDNLSGESPRLAVVGAIPADS